MTVPVCVTVIVFVIAIAIATGVEGVEKVGKKVGEEGGEEETSVCRRVRGASSRIYPSNPTKRANQLCAVRYLPLYSSLPPPF